MTMAAFFGKPATAERRSAIPFFLLAGPANIAPPNVLLAIEHWGRDTEHVRERAIAIQNCSQLSRLHQFILRPIVSIATLHARDEHHSSCRARAKKEAASIHFSQVSRH
jgi:hypothetical protein